MATPFSRRKLGVVAIGTHHGEHPLYAYFYRLSSLYAITLGVHSGHAAA